MRTCRTRDTEKHTKKNELCKGAKGHKTPKVYTHKCMCVALSSRAARTRVVGSVWRRAKGVCITSAPINRPGVCVRLCLRCRCLCYKMLNTRASKCIRADKRTHTHTSANWRRYGTTLCLNVRRIKATRLDGAGVCERVCSDAWIYKRPFAGTWRSVWMLALNGIRIGITHYGRNNSVNCTRICVGLVINHQMEDLLSPIDP